MNILNGKPNIGEVYVNENSSIEEHFRATLAVVGQGVDGQGYYYIKVCSDKSVRLCALCNKLCANNQNVKIGREREF